jgi:predicted MPP superfamily phosphohydrolase
MTRSSLRRKYASGVFEVAGTTFHLNNGVGAGKWTDFRFLCPPEATYVELTGRNDAIKPV